MPAAAAFVLGAGLGTRLRPLTEHLPKPLIPLWNRPLITHAFNHLISAGVGRFVVNTHWQAQEYSRAFPEGHYEGLPLQFRHEPVLLETAGGIANVADLLREEESFWVYNGDIFSTLPLAPALVAHEASGALATLILRRQGPEPVVAFDESCGRVLDLRNLLGSGAPARHQFTGIYLCRRGFLDWLEPGKIESSRTVFLEIIRQGGLLGGVVLDEGLWLDLGDRDSYLQAHRLTAAGPAVGGDPRCRGICAIAPDAEVHPSAQLEDCIVWSGARVAADARLRRCIVRTGSTASGDAEDRDF